MGLGTDDAKLIAAICSRNKQHLGTTPYIYDYDVVLYNIVVRYSPARAHITYSIHIPITLLVLYGRCRAMARPTTAVLTTAMPTTGMVSQIYYAEHQKSLPKLIGSECSGWFAYLAGLAHLYYRYQSTYHRYILPPLLQVRLPSQVHRAVRGRVRSVPARPHPDPNLTLALPLPLTLDLTLTLTLALTLSRSDLRLLDLAMDGLGTTEAALVEFLCARPPARVRAAKAKWEAHHDASRTLPLPLTT